MTYDVFFVDKKDWIFSNVRLTSLFFYVLPLLVSYSGFIMFIMFDMSLLLTEIGSYEHLSLLKIPLYIRLTR